MRLESPAFEPGGKIPPRFFKLFALDSMLHLEQEATKSDLEKAMEGHILEKAELMGRYEHIR